MHAADHGLADGLGLLVDLRLQAVQAVQLFFFAGVVFQVGGRCAGATRIHKRERLVEIHIANQLQCLLEILFRLTGKAHNEVRGQDDVGTRFTQAAHDGFELQRSVAAFHCSQNTVAAGLYGQVQKGDQLGQIAVGGDQARGHFLGVRGGVANALDTRDLVHVLQQHGKVGNLASDVGRATVGVHVLAQQRHFTHTLVGQVSHFHQHVVKGAGDFGAAGVGHHTEAAVLAATFHDGHKGRIAFHACGGQGVELFDFRKADVHLRAAAVAALDDKFGQTMQGLWSEHHVHVGSTTNNGVTFLTGDTATHANHQIGIERFQMLNPAQIREHLFLRFFAHRTGIEQDDVCFFGVGGQLHGAILIQDIGHFFGVVLVHLAAKGANEELAGRLGSSIRAGGGRDCGVGHRRSRDGCISRGPLKMMNRAL